ncbi:uncharacterized protein [Gossypium hirsutum]|uniref:Uncharacterized protein n=1 Tax=Gossypium hirsutum TaxID=3635 RepID=A0ABM3BI22_GOSHI|nr:uncharacterized protein LOC121227872 [Gossypium hirsutum]
MAAAGRWQRRRHPRWPGIKKLPFFRPFDFQSRKRTIFHRRWPPWPPTAVQTQKRYGAKAVGVADDGRRGVRRHACRRGEAAQGRVGFLLLLKIGLGFGPLGIFFIWVLWVYCNWV